MDRETAAAATLVQLTLFSKSHGKVCQFLGAAGAAVAAASEWDRKYLTQHM